MEYNKNVEYNSKYFKSLKTFNPFCEQKLRILRDKSKMRYKFAANWIKKVSLLLKILFYFVPFHAIKKEYASIYK